MQPWHIVDLCREKLVGNEVCLVWSFHVAANAAFLAATTTAATAAAAIATILWKFRRNRPHRRRFTALSHYQGSGVDAKRRQRFLVAKRRPLHDRFIRNLTAIGTAVGGNVTVLGGHGAKQKKKIFKIVSKQSSVSDPGPFVRIRIGLFILSPGPETDPWKNAT